jgi:hypothetical protein
MKVDFVPPTPELPGRAMNFDSFYSFVEQSALSQWLIQSPSLFAFPGILSLHAIGMAFLVGANVAVDLRLLGFAPGVSVSGMERFFPIMHLGFWLNAVSGVLLLIAYPTKALTNPVFYLKLSFITLALLDTRLLRNQVLRDTRWDDQPIAPRYKLLAVFSIALWIGAVTAGRLLAYTCVRLTVEQNCY